MRLTVRHSQAKLVPIILIALVIEAIAVGCIVGCSFDRAQIDVSKGSLWGPSNTSSVGSDTNR